MRDPFGVVIPTTSPEHHPASMYAGTKALICRCGETWPCATATPTRCPARLHLDVEQWACCVLDDGHDDKHRSGRYEW